MNFLNPTRRNLNYFAAGAAAALAGGCASLAVSQPVVSGLDVAAADNFSQFRGKRVGLITNQTGVDRQGRRNLDLMQAGGVAVSAVFAPEHGYFGVEDTSVAGARDPATGVVIHSLYESDARRPKPEWLSDLDALVFDVADIGARFYTYATTLAYCMEAAAPLGLPVHVLDRPNPITGLHVEGPMLDPTNTSFVGYAPMPVRHGMTIGELALLFNERIGARLDITRMRGWRRARWFDETGLSWINPSPNMRSLRAALLYPGIALLEYAPNYSVGRGTPLPFEQVGATFIDAERLTSEVSAAGVAGVRVAPVDFMPTSGPAAAQSAHGLRIEVTDRGAFRSTAFGIEVAAALQRLYPGAIDFDANRPLLGSNAVVDALKASRPAAEIHALCDEGLDTFAPIRQRCLLYA